MAPGNSLYLKSVVHVAALHLSTPIHLMHMIRRETGWVFPLLFLVLILGSASPAVGQDTLRHTEDSELPDYHSHRFDEPERYAERWNDPRRDDWQKPGVLIEAMGVEKEMTVADLGAGTGYFLPHLAKAVGPNGHVLAVDIEPAMLDYIEDWTSEEGIDNVETVHADPEDTRLDASSVDRILTVNTWHHIPNRPSYSEHLAGRLRDGGSVWVVDYETDAPMGPPKEYRFAPETIVGEMEKGGFEAEVRDLGLPHQFVVVGVLD